METIISGITAIDVFSAQQSSAPDWIKLTPRGGFTARDGRQFDTLPEVLAARFNADGIAIPVDVDHATVKKAQQGEQAPAVGWIEELQARPDGLYGRVKWLSEGLLILAAKTHRFISPALMNDEAGRAVWLHSAALVAAPALSMPAVASAGGALNQGNRTLDTKALTELLGLPTNAAMPDIMAAVIRLQKSGEAGQTTAQVATAYEGIASTLAAELQTHARSRRLAKVEQAITLGAVPPSLRDWCIELTTADEKKFDTFCATIGRPFSYLKDEVITAEHHGTLQRQLGREPVTLNAETERVAKTLGIAVSSLTGG